jgi:hypothetical protein
VGPDAPKQLILVDDLAACDMTLRQLRYMKITKMYFRWLNLIDSMIFEQGFRPEPAGVLDPVWSCGELP